MVLTIAELTRRFARDGRVVWIGVRPERRAPMVSLEQAMIGLGGLEGDRRKHPGKRAVTLIQSEHLPVIASLAGRDGVSPSDLRRNIVVEQINLRALRDRDIRVGDAVLRLTGPCDPCGLMERVIGHGGYNAMRGHGGMTAEVLQAGAVAVGSAVIPVPAPTPDNP